MWIAGESPAGGTVSRPVVAARRAQGLARCHVQCRERCGRAGLLSDETAMIRSAEALSAAEGNTDRPLSCGRKGSAASEHPRHVRPRRRPERAATRPGSRTGAAEERRAAESMKNGWKQSDSAIVPMSAARSLSALLRLQERIARPIIHARVATSRSRWNTG